MTAALRVLFLHATSSGLTAEYKVHTTLATHANRAMLDPYFIWQSPIKLDSIQLIPGDFGRDMTIAPKPGRFQRAGLMARNLPKTLAFVGACIRRIQPDLIYTSQQTFDVFLASLLGRYYHVPHVIHVHYSVGPWLGRYTLNAIRKSSRLIAVSEYVRQTALLQGVASSSIRTVLNPAPVSPQPCDPGNQDIRAEFSLEDNTPLVVAVGRLDPGKGHLDLLSAFAQVAERMPAARLLICGASTTRNDYEGTLRQHAERLGLNHCVIFAGHRSDISSILCSSNVFCLPTELEPFGLVFLEAMTAELPIVAYYSGGVPELVSDHQTGLLSYPGDIQALALNLLSVLSDKDYAQQLGAAGKRRASIEFAPTRVAGAWLNLVQEMVG